MSTFKRVPLIVGSSYLYKKPQGQHDQIVANAGGLEITAVKIRNPFELQEFAKTVAAAWQDSLHLRGAPRVAETPEKA